MAQTTTHNSAISITVTNERFEPTQLASALQLTSMTGAVATFTGFCRDDEGTLEALELEHYPGMAEAELERMASDVFARFQPDALHVVHRYGLIHPGEEIVFVGASSSHRRAAFQAVDCMMDFLKTDAPFWKKLHLKDQSQADDPRDQWVHAQSRDHKDRVRWLDNKS